MATFDEFFWTVLPNAGQTHGSFEEPLKQNRRLKFIKKESHGQRTLNEWDKSGLCQENNQL